MNQSKRLLAFFCVLMMLLTLAACGSQSTTDEPTDAPAAEAPTEAAESSEKADAETEETAVSIRHDSFVYATSREPSSLDPAAFQGCYNGYIIDTCIYDTLVKMANDGTITPHLATDWSYEDNYTLNITIRDDVYFSNGTKLTAEDVVFSVLRLCSSDMYAATFSCLDQANCVATDDTHLTFKFNTPFAGFMPYMSYGISSIVSKAYVEENGEEYLAHNPMGSGAFIFDSWITGDSVTMHRNEEYWGKTPNFDELTIRFITDNTTRFMEFETGSVDAIDNLANADVETMLNGDVPGTLYQQTGFDVIHLGMSYEYEPFQDLRVRQAIAMAIDMQALVANVFGATAAPAVCYENEGLIGYSEIGLYDYDPDGAKALLAEAGYGDGMALDMTVSSSESFVKIAEIIQAYLSDVGITLTVNVADQSTALFAFMGGQSVIGLTESMANVADPSLIFDPLRMAGIHLGMRTNDQQLDDLLQAGIEAIDEAERAQLYEEANQMIHDQVSVLPIANVMCSYAVQPHVEHFDDAMTGIPDLTTVTFNQ